jgi:hypothetical protein
VCISTNSSSNPFCLIARDHSLRNEIHRSHFGMNYLISYYNIKSKRTHELNFEVFERIARKGINTANQYYLINSYALNYNMGKNIDLSSIQLIPYIGLKFTYNKENIYDTTLRSRQIYLSQSVNLGLDFVWQPEISKKISYLNGLKLFAGLGTSMDMIVGKLKNVKYEVPLNLSYGVNFGIAYVIKNNNSK